MYPIDDMTVFVHVVDREGFSAAGRELRLTTAVVSSRVAKLEQRIGVRLLNRTTRSVIPTEEGRLYYQYCQKCLSEMIGFEHRLAELRQRPAGALRVSLPVALGRQIITPLIARFVEGHPDIQLRVQMTDRVVDLVEEEVDIAVRKGEPPPSSLIMRRIAPDLRVVCGAPEYFENHGIPDTPSDLIDHNCLLLRFPGSTRFLWRFEHANGDRTNMRVAGAMDSDSSDVLIDWALAGHGLIMKSVWDIATHIENKALVSVLHDYWPRNMSLSAMMPPRRPQPTKTRAFVDHLVEQFKEHSAARLTDPDVIPSAAETI